MPKPKPLPDKLSALIRVALKDLRKAERSKDYVVDMGNWHKPNGACKVCLAGAVMAFSLRMPRGVDFLYSHEFDGETNSKLFALNYLRQGCVSWARSCVGRQSTVGTHDLTRKIPDYWTGRKNIGFYKALEKLAKNLKEAGE